MAAPGSRAAARISAASASNAEKLRVLVGRPRGQGVLDGVGTSAYRRESPAHSRLFPRGKATMPGEESADAPTADVTQLLLAWSSGDRSSGDQLLDRVYDELRRQAGRAVRREPG